MTTQYNRLLELYNKINEKYPGMLVEEKETMYDILFKLNEKAQQQKPKVKKIGALKRFWLSTVFPDMIKRKKEEKRIKKEAATEARREAMQSPEYKKIIKQKEIDKLTGKAKTDKLKKLADAFSMGGQGQGGLNTTDKINGMLNGMGSNGFDNVQNNIMGNQPQPHPQQQYTQQPLPQQPQQQYVQPQPQLQPQPQQQNSFGNLNPQTKIDEMLGTNKPNKKQLKQESPQDKINRMLGM